MRRGWIRWMRYRANDMRDSMHEDDVCCRRVAPPQPGLIAAASLLAGCAATPVPEPCRAGARPVATGPASRLPAARWRSATAGGRSWADPQLTALVDLALQRNNDLAAAGLPLRNAQLQAGNALGNRFPTPSARVSAGASRVLDSGASTSRRPQCQPGRKLGGRPVGPPVSAQRASDWEAARPPKWTARR